VQPKNHIELLPGGLVAVRLTQGFDALIDLADLFLIAPYRWCVRRTGRSLYAQTMVSKDGRKRPLRMHHLIQPLLPGELTDHRNRNGLDNRRSNLRKATKADNQRNQPRKSTNTSGFRGVSWDRNQSKWVANIKMNYRHFYLGAYDLPEQAARAYDRAARQYHGEFASLNFPAEGLDS